MLPLALGHFPHAAMMMGHMAHIASLGLRDDGDGNWTDLSQARTDTAQNQVGQGSSAALAGEDMANLLVLSVPADLLSDMAVNRDHFEG